MNKRHAGFVVGLLLAASHPAVARGEENVAAARMGKMAAFLANAPRIGVSIDCAWDVVQDSGEKIEIGERRSLTLLRPDRARVDVTGRDGSHRGLAFNGTQLTAFDVTQNVYATVESKGTVDEALAHYTQRLKMRVPLRELFAADLPQKLKDILPTARLIGTETVGAKTTEHVVFRHGEADVQLWIARDGEPLPQRIVITYRRAEGQPQFRGDFHGWTFSPEAADSVFTHTPAEGAEKIPILAPGRRGEAAEEKKP